MPTVAGCGMLCKAIIKEGCLAAPIDMVWDIGCKVLNLPGSLFLQILLGKLLFLPSAPISN